MFGSNLGDLSPELLHTTFQDVSPYDLKNLTEVNKYFYSVFNVDWRWKKFLSKFIDEQGYCIEKPLSHLDDAGDVKKLLSIVSYYFPKSYDNDPSCYLSYVRQLPDWCIQFLESKSQNPIAGFYWTMYLVDQSKKYIQDNDQKSFKNLTKKILGQEAFIATNNPAYHFLLLEFLANNNNKVFKGMKNFNRNQKIIEHFILGLKGIGLNDFARELENNYLKIIEIPRIKITFLKFARNREQELNLPKHVSRLLDWINKNNNDNVFVLPRFLFRLIKFIMSDEMFRYEQFKITSLKHFLKNLFDVQLNLENIEIPAYNFFRPLLQLNTNVKSLQYLFTLVDLKSKTKMDDVMEVLTRLPRPLFELAVHRLSEWVTYYLQSWSAKQSDKLEDQMKAMRVFSKVFETRLREHSDPAMHALLKNRLTYLSLENLLCTFHRDKKTHIRLYIFTKIWTLENFIAYSKLEENEKLFFAIFCDYFFETMFAKKKQLTSPPVSSIFSQLSHLKNVILESIMNKEISISDIIAADNLPKYVQTRLNQIFDAPFFNGSNLELACLFFASFTNNWNERDWNNLITLANTDDHAKMLHVFYLFYKETPNLRQHLFCPTFENFKDFFDIFLKTFQGKITTEMYNQFISEKTAHVLDDKTIDDLLTDYNNTFTTGIKRELEVNELDDLISNLFKTPRL